MRIVIFDGMNGSGKSTLRHFLMQKVNYNLLTIDRFTPSVWVYDRLRGIDRADILEFEDEFDKLNPLVLICLCSPKVAKMRARESFLRQINFDIEDQNKAFDIYYSRYSRYSNLFRINTENSINSCIDKIIKML